MNCYYKSEPGFCDYPGTGCAQGLVRSVRYESDPSYMIVKYAELSDETIERIAEAGVERLKRNAEG